MKIIPKCIKTKRHLCASGSILLPLAQKWGLVGVMAMAALSAFGVQTVSAASLEVSVPENLSVSIVPTADGAFAESEKGRISVTATADFGYTLSVNVQDGKNALKSESGATLPSFQSGQKYTAADGLTGTWPVNTWGYRPNKFNSSDNSYYRPGPISRDVIDNVSNAVADVTNNYDVQIAAKVNTAQTAGTYSNTFVFEATANAVQYSIKYNNCAESDATNCPANIVNTSSTKKSFVLEDRFPSRNGYIFRGWCDKQTNDEKCSGNIYQPNNSYTLTPDTGTLALYAMWEDDSRYIGDLGEMQSFKCSQIDKIENYGIVTDVRDGNVYKVAKLKDEKCWMIDNLRIGDDKLRDLTLTSDTSDVSEEGYTLKKTPVDYNVMEEFDNTYDQYHAETFYISPIHPEYGGYYSYDTAVAGSGKSLNAFGQNAPYSICPKGWRLPIGDTLQESDAQTLIDIYGGTGVEGNKALRAVPVPGFSLVGLVWNNGYGIAGVHYGATYLTSTVHGSGGTARFYFSTTEVRPDYDGGHRFGGFSVRCISRE